MPSSKLRQEAACGMRLSSRIISTVHPPMSARITDGSFSRSLCWRMAAYPCGNSFTSCTEVSYEIPSYEKETGLPSRSKYARNAFFSRPKLVSGKPARKDHRRCGRCIPVRDFFGDGRQRQQIVILICCLILLERLPSAANNIVFSIITEDVFFCVYGSCSYSAKPEGNEQCAVFAAA